MRILALAALIALSAAIQAAEIGYEGARHLLNRTGFGATDAEVRAFASLDRAQAVDRLLAQTTPEAALAPPAFVDQPFVPFYQLRALSAEERLAEQRKVVEQSFELRSWWLREMLRTPSPLTERMTLFWHGHFATSQQKVRYPQLMYRQNVLLRREALGNFGALLHAIAKDPAMLIYLDNATSRSQAPNENFAREVMELFTLGEGHYGENDIKEAARAFTGWSLDRDTGKFVYRRLWHDDGEKTFLGRSGHFDGDDIIDILLERPETAQLIATKVWKEFVSPQPDAAQVRRWAGEFRAGGYAVKPLLRAALTSDAFWAPQHRAALIKSPVDVVVGTMRTLAIQPLDLRPAAVACAGLGQNLFAPPNVKGWAGGEAWIDSATLLGRKQWVDRIISNSSTVLRNHVGTQPAETAMTAMAMEGDEMAKATPEVRLRRAMERGMAEYVVDLARFEASIASENDRAATLQKLLLAMPAVGRDDATGGESERIRALLADAAFQLK